MNTKLLKVLVMAPAMLLLVTMPLMAQFSYSNAVTSLNPIGYWPMHEVEGAAQGDIETNYGTLGPLGEGFYPDWAASGPVTSIKRGLPGVLTNDHNAAVNFTRGASPAAATYTNFLYVPHTVPQTTLNPPFSVECWFYPTNAASEDIWAQCGDEGFNQGGNSGGNAGSLAGVRLTWQNGTNTGFQIFNLDGAQFSAGFSGDTNVGSTPVSPPFNWYHLVLFCDANTNFGLYVNGIQSPLETVATGNGVGTYTPDTWTPLTIGGGRGGTRACAGYIDEFAVYTNVLADVGTHYSDGINGAAGQYFHDVTNDHPVVYLRMDAPAAYVPPSPSTWPVLANYGKTNGVAVGNGVYTPGTLPGQLISPLVNPNGVPFGGVPSNLAGLNGISSFADAGFAPAYNPIGAVPFSVTALFKGNPCDNRTNTVVGHSDSSWSVTLNNAGRLVWRFGTNTPAGLTSTGIYNDSRWHHVAAVYEPNSNPALQGTNFLFVDGVLDSITNNASTNGFGPGSKLDVIIGSDPQYTNNPAGVGRQFAGQVCDVALFNQALNPSQIQTLYSACDVAPYIVTQPPTGRAVNGGSGTSIPFGVTANGSQTLTYQWYFNNSSNYGGATKLVDDVVHYTNSTTAQLTVTNLTDNDRGFYYVVAANSYGSVTSILASLTAYARPVILSQAPVPYTNLFTLFAGTSPTFSVTTAGAQPISYYWFTNGVLDAAMTSSTMVWPGVSIGSITNVCVVSNSLTTVTSVVWTASVVVDPTAPYPTNVLAANPIGYWRLNEGPDNNSGNNGAVCHDYAGGNDGLFTNVLLVQAGYNHNTDPNETSATFGEFGSIPAINEDVGQIQGIDFAATNGANGEFTVEAWVNGVSSGLFPQNVGSPLATKGIFNVDDQFNLGIDTTKTHYRFYVRDAGNTVHIVGSGTAPAIDNNWHHIAGVCDEANGQLLLYYDGALVNTTAIPKNSGVFEAPEPMSIGAGTVDGVNYTNQFIGSINDVAVYNYALTASQVASQYSAAGVPPAFALAPSNSISLNPGATLMIPAIVIGTIPLSYQWSDVSGGTNLLTGSTNGLPLNATLTVSNVPAAWNNDQLQLTVNNAFGSVTADVLLFVNTNAPQITQNLPSPVTIVSGQSYIYTIGISASTFSPFYYQWYNSLGPISGATNATYTATAGSPGSSPYSVVITNAFGSVTSTVSLFTSISVPPAPTTGYATNILGLNPAGYWPMHEVQTAPAGDAEYNYGSLGLLGAGYYPDWVRNYGGFTRQQSGALPGDGDSALGLTFGTGNSGTTLSFTNGVYVPHNSPLTTLNPPFTVECWFFPTNSPTGEAVWAQTGAAGLNDGIGGDLVNYNGIMLNWANGTFVPYGFNGENGGITANNGDKLISGGTAGGSSVEAVNHWYHVVVTCDAQTNFMLYVNGAAVTANPTADVGKYSPDSWTPLTIGSGNGGLRSSSGAVDEFAVYTNVITDISTHYSDGTNGGPGVYFHDVTNDNPVVYLRLDAPPYTAPPANTWPVLFNYGTAGVNGLYTPGTVPGIEPGPFQTNGTPFIGLSGANVSLFSGVSSFADAGNAAVLNPTGSNANFTVMAMFRGNPCDNRVQTLAGHGTNSWQLSITTNGCIVFNAGNGNHAAAGTGKAVGDIPTVGVYNDGNWHQVAAVNQANVVSIYVDGMLDTNGTPNGVTPESIIPGNTSDVIIGSDPVYTNIPTGVGRQFAGQVCEVAFFTNALTAGQVGKLFVATGSSVPPFFAPAPPANVSATPGSTLIVPAGADGTAPLNYQWQIITNNVTNLLVTGFTNNLPLDATLTVGNVPAAWDGGQLELTVTNAFGTNSTFVTLSIVNTVNTNPTNIVFSVANNQLVLTWPSDHTGWQLQAQTNSVAVGLNNNWFNVNGSTSTNQLVVPINLTNGTVFYRLMYP